MKEYRLLKPSEAIQVGDEYKTSIIKWHACAGWSGRSVHELLRLLDDTGQMRREIPKVVKNKTCVSWA